MAFSSQTHEAPDELRDLLSIGYSLQQKYNTYNRKKIPTPEDEDYVSFEDSMGENHRQNRGAQDYDAFDRKTEETFGESNLNIARFRSKTEPYDKSTDSNSRASRLNRQIKELEAMLEGGTYTSLYFLRDDFMPVKLVDNRVIQGRRYHPFEKDALGLISELWNRREILSPLEIKLQSHRRTYLDKLEKRMGLTHDRFEGIVRTIHTAAKRKKIHLKVRYPKGSNDVYIQVVQDSM